MKTATPEQTPTKNLKARALGILRIELVWVSLVLCFFIAIFMSGAILHFGSTYYASTDILQSFPAFLIEEKSPPPHNYAVSDDILQYLPWRDFAWQSLRQFQMPLWNPYNAGGRPLLANMQNGIFNPVNWFDFILGHRLGLFLTNWAHLYLAGLFSFLYFRSLKLVTAAALVGSIAYMFMGYMVVWLYSPLAASFLFLPLLLYLIERRVTGRLSNLGFVIALSLVTAWDVFAGHPETLLLNNVNAGIYLVYRLLTLPRVWGSIRARVQIFGLFIGGGLLGGVLTAIQLAPFAEYTFNSLAYYIRSTKGAAPVGLGSHKMITFLLPNPYGNPIYYKDLDFSQPVYTEISGGYVGPTVIFLALCALWLARKNRLTWFFAGGSVVGLSIVYGYWPIFQLVVVAAPVGVAFQRMMGYVGFFLITLMALALHAIYDLPPKGVRPRLTINDLGHQLTDVRLTIYDLVPKWVVSRFSLGKRWLENSKSRIALNEQASEEGNSIIVNRQSSIVNPYSWLWLGIAGLIFLLGMVGLFWWFSGSGLVPFERGSVRNFEIPQFIFIGGLFVVSVLAIMAALRWPRYAVLSMAVLVVVVFGQTGLFGRTYRAATNAAYFYPQTPTLTAIEQTGGRVAVAGSENNLPAEANIWYKIEQANGYDAVEVRWYAQLLTEAKSRWPYWDNPIPLNLFNIKQVMASSSNPDFTGIEATNTKQLRRASKQRNINLYLNQNYQPPFRMVYNAVERSEPQAKQALLDGTINPINTLVFIQGAAPPLVSNSNPPAASPEVKVISRSATHISLKVNNPQSGYLYIDQTYFPGWQAKVNGQPVNLYRANYAFTALPVGAGDLNIELEYDPFSFKLGAALSFLAILVIAGLGFWLWRNQRRALPAS